LEDLRQSLDYSGKAPAPKPKRSREREAGDTAPDRDRDFSLGDGWSMFLKVLFFAILGGLLVFLVYNFLKDSERRSRSQNGEPTEEEEAEAALSLEALIEQLDRTELAPYIQEAEASQRYELAIRLQFLAVLKKLNQQGYIHWKKDRTNRVYLQQLYGQPPYTAFRDLSYIFEHYWYGPNRPDAPTYALLKPRFEQFIVQLQPLSNR
jgi:hypothetical protein